MAFKFDKAFNKFAQAGNTLNKGLNKAIGKDVFGEIKEIEQPKEYPPFDSFPEYTVPEPEEFEPLKGEEKSFRLEGNYIHVSANLDACFKYKKEFQKAARYYADRFIFKYKNCVEDFDSFLHYFEDMYMEGLIPMGHRAYSLILYFGVINADLQKFTSKHIDTYSRAINSYSTLAGIETAKNQAAENVGNTVGNSIQMRGGGFGMKGAMKGVAKAEAFNLGMGLMGKYIASQNKMTKEDKAKVFEKFNEELFFNEVYNDYYDTFMTMVQMLAENKKVGNITIYKGAEFNNTLNNLQNAMFPKDKVAPTLANLISTHPFNQELFKVLALKIGETEEVKQIIEYFTGCSL